MSGIVIAERPLPPPPAEVSRRKLISAMRASAVTSNGTPLWRDDGTGAVPAYLSGLPQGLQDEWHAASVIERSDPLIEAARASLGLTAADVDALFRGAT